MIVSGAALRERIENGAIGVVPFDPRMVNPASVDITLGEQIRVYRNAVRVMPRLPWAPAGWELRPRCHVLDGVRDALGITRVLDAAACEPVLTHRVRRGEAFMLRPGIGYLAHTAETIDAGGHVLVVDGKSSVGRLFVKVHETAGYIDPGFHGAVTLEITAQQPTLIYGGMRIGQIRAHTVHGHVEPYAGHYRGASARGAVPSQTWRQLREDGIVK